MIRIKKTEYEKIKDLNLLSTLNIFFVLLKRLDISKNEFIDIECSLFISEYV